MKADKYKKLSLFHFAEEIKKNHAKKKLRGVILGNFGAMNTGDEAILAGDLAELQAIKNLRVSVVSRFPDEVKRMHQTPAVSFYHFRESVREIKRSDFVLIGGGGLINKVERGPIGFFYQLYLLFLFFVVPALYKKKLYVVGLGVYRNANWFILAILSLLLKRALVITVRDSHSHELLKSKNIHSSLCKDNSFLMELLPQRIIATDPFFKKIYTKEKTQIGFALVRPSKRNERKRIVTEMATFIAKNYETAHFWFYTLDFHPNYVNDEVFAHEVLSLAEQKAGKRIEASFIPKEWGPQKLFSSLKLMDFVVGMRLHSLIFSYRTGIPFVGIAYDKKCSNFLHAIGKESISPLSVKASQLQSRLKELQ